MSHLGIERRFARRPPGGVENKLGPILPRRAGGAIDQITLLVLDAQVEGLAFGRRFVNRGHGGVSRLHRYWHVRNDDVITRSKVLEGVIAATLVANPANPTPACFTEGRRARC
jgi:hypothetical protein